MAAGVTREPQFAEIGDSPLISALLGMSLAVAGGMTAVIGR
jgi:hypothetical protein